MKKVTITVEDNGTQVAQITAEVNDLNALLEVKAAIEAIFSDDKKAAA